MLPSTGWWYSYFQFRVIGTQISSGIRTKVSGVVMLDGGAEVGGDREMGGWRKAKVRRMLKHIKHFGR